MPDTAHSQGLIFNPAFLRAVNQLSQLSDILFTDGSQGISHARRDEDFGVRFDGIPDRPYISGVLYDSAHGDHVTELSFDVSQVPQEVMQCDRKLEPKKQ